MDTVGIWSNSDGLADHLRDRLGERFRFVRGRHPADFAPAALGGEADLLVVAPDAAGLAGLTVLHPRLALLPGGCVWACRQVRATSAVSYGLGSQNTLTLSSMTGDCASVALQRELLTLSGRPVERQEWVLPFRGDPGEADRLLCLVGAMLLLDCDPSAP